MLDTFGNADWTSDKTDQKMYLVCRILCKMLHIRHKVLFSVEAEYLGIVKGASIGITMQSMARDFGDERIFRIATDCSVSKGIAPRLGLEKNP